MKNNLILEICLFLAPLGLFATYDINESLKTHLSEAYALNNQLIYKKSSLDTQESLEKLSNNYTGHLQFIKKLSDERLTRKLKEEKVESFNESIVLKNHVLDLYQREVFLLKESRSTNRFQEARVSKVNEHLHVKRVNEDDGPEFVFKVVSLYCQLSQNPKMLGELEGVLSESLFNRWQRESLSDQVLEDPIETFSIEEMKVAWDDSLNRGVFYVFGTAPNPFMMRMVVCRTQWGGYFVDDAIESSDPKLIERTKKATQYYENC